MRASNQVSNISSFNKIPMTPKTKAGAALFIFVVAEALSLGLAFSETAA